MARRASLKRIEPTERRKYVLALEHIDKDGRAGFRKDEDKHDPG